MCTVACAISSLVYAQIPMPENASPALGGGLGWICNPGYKHVGFTCQKIELPENARFYGPGNNWRCIRGYRKVENQCLKILVPANATLNIVGDDWVCKEGFEPGAFGCTFAANEKKFGPNT